MVSFCLCVHDASGTYYQHALVTMASVMDTASEKVCCYLLTDATVPHSIRTQFSEVATKLGHVVKIIDVCDIPKDLATNVPEAWSQATLYRLMLPLLLAEEDKTIYLDCDIVCRMDICQLWKINMTAHCIAGCQELLETDSRQVKYLKRLNVDPKYYFNAGVLILNLDRIRSLFPNFSIDLFSLLRLDLPYQDQDALNIYFSSHNKNEICFLDTKYNYICSECSKLFSPMSSFADKILHFTKYKPWNVFSIPAIFYWEYYRKIFPSDNIMNRLEALPMPEKRYDQMQFMLSNDLAWRTVRRIQDISQHGILGAICKRIRD